MILPDTSVWVDHLRQREQGLTRALQEGKILMHTMIIGELACGNLANRQQQLNDWRRLPILRESSNEDVMNFIESHRLMGRGIGLVDAHLLHSVFNHVGALLWTRDGSLKKLAEELCVGYSESA